MKTFYADRNEKFHALAFCLLRSRDTPDTMAQAFYNAYYTKLFQPIYCIKPLGLLNNI